MVDLSQLLEAASDFASFPGLHNDDAVKDFLEQFPLPVIFNALQSDAHVDGLEDAVVACLDKIFSTKYGASLIPNYAPFVQLALQTNSERIQLLACKAVSYLLQKIDEKSVGLQTIIDYNIYPLLINCLLEGNEQTAEASINSIKEIALCPEGISIIFPAQNGEGVQLKALAKNASSLGSVRILALIASLFSASNSIATAVYESDLLSLFYAEIYCGHDMLKTLSALEILYELVGSPHSGEFLLKTSMLNLLTDMVRNSSVDSMLRSKSALIGGRILSSTISYTTLEESNVADFLLTIEGRLRLLEGQNTDEYENFIEALGLCGATFQGANLLLRSSSNAVRFVVDAAFDRAGRGKQLAALDALGIISGTERPQDQKILRHEAEEMLKTFIYQTASKGPKLTPAGLLLSVLQQEAEVRLAGYRLIAALVSRQWCLMQICSKLNIIAAVTDPKRETTKKGMEARHECCLAISNCLASSSLLEDATVSEMAGKIQEAIRRGPYFGKSYQEAQPVVGVMERF